MPAGLRRVASLILMPQPNFRLAVELFSILLILILTLILAQTNLVQFITTSNILLKVIFSFVGGIFYTSIITAALSVPILTQVARPDFSWPTAVIAGGGAVLGDWLIFGFIKFVVLEQILQRVRQSFKTEFFKETLRTWRWVLIFMGALIIASPLPDELGILLMGLAKINLVRFIFISYVLNTFGILALLFLTNI